MCRITGKLASDTLYVLRNLECVRTELGADAVTFAKINPEALTWTRISATQIVCGRFRITYSPEKKHDSGAGWHLQFKGDEGSYTLVSECFSLDAAKEQTKLHLQNMLALDAQEHQNG